MNWIPRTVTAIIVAIGLLLGAIAEFVIDLIDLLPSFPRLVRGGIACAFVGVFLKLLLDHDLEGAAVVAVPMSLATKWYFDLERDDSNGPSSSGM